MTPAALPPVLDLAGTAVFALTGALLAARLHQTFVTMAFFALVTGVGGGSLRDMLLGAPAFWLHDPWVAPVIFGTALVAWFTPHRWWEKPVLEWADAAGLGAYAVLGTAKALAWTGIVRFVIARGDRVAQLVLAPVVRDRKGEFVEFFDAVDA